MLELALDDFADLAKVAVDVVLPFDYRNGISNCRQGVSQFVGKGGQEFVLAAVGIPEGLFQALVVADVDARADVAAEFVVRTVQRNTFFENPAILAVVALQPVFHGEGHPGVEGARVDLQAPVAVFRVKVLGPAVSQLLFKWAAHEVQPLLVEPGGEFVFVACPDHDGCGIGQQGTEYEAANDYGCPRPQPNRIRHNDASPVVESSPFPGRPRSRGSPAHAEN